MQFLPSEILEYHRKSRQDDPSKTVTEVLAAHKRIADEWVEKNLPDQIPDNNIYMERASGETIRDREQFQKVLQRIESSDIKAVFVIEPQRLGRGDLEDCGHIINMFQWSNTRIITPHRMYDLSRDDDRMFLEMELKQGNQYLEYTRKILKRGKSDRVKRGCYIMTRPPYGYQKTVVDKNKTLIPDPEQAKVVQLIFDLYLEGKGVTSIVDYLNNLGIKPAQADKFSRASIFQIIKNPVYIGKITWNRRNLTNVVENGQVVKKSIRNAEPEIYDGLHEAIISEDVFNKAQEIRIGKHISHAPVSYVLINPLTKLIFCGKCGRAMSLYGRENRDLRYICGNQKNCRSGGVLMKHVLNDVVDILTAEIENRELQYQKGQDNAHERWEEELNFLQSRIQKLDEKELALWRDRYESAEPMPDRIFRKLTDEVIRERKKAKELLKMMKDEEPEEANKEERILQLKTALECIHSEMPAEEKNKILEKCISKITVTRDLVPSNVRNTTYEKVPYKINLLLKI